MKIISFNTLSLAAAAFVALGSSTASAVSIVITTGVDNTGTSNVLFNDGAFPDTPTLVTGTINGSPGFVVNFTSASGNNQIEAPAAGQARIEGLAGNDPFTSLTFELANNATFTAAVLNPDVTNAAGDGTIDFAVSYLLGDGLTPHLEQFTVDSNGQNFFRIDALPDARITSVTYSTSDTSFADTAQFRIGGLAPGEPPPPVPDSGATLMLLGGSLAAIGALRRKLLKRSPVA